MNIYILSECTLVIEDIVLFLLENNLNLLKYKPSIEEIHISSTISRRGYLNFLEEKGSGWVKRFVVIRRPFAFIYNHEKDSVERGLINLGTARIEYNDEELTNGTRVKKIKLFFF